MTNPFVSEVADFIASFSNLKGTRKTAQERIQYWIGVLTNPELHHPELFLSDADPKALTKRLRQARQNLNRLLVRYHDKHGVNYLPLARLWHKAEVIEAPLDPTSTCEVSQ